MIAMRPNGILKNSVALRFQVVSSLLARPMFMGVYNFSHTRKTYLRNKKTSPSSRNEVDLWLSFREGTSFSALPAAPQFGTAHNCSTNVLDMLLLSGLNIPPDGNGPNAPDLSKLKGGTLQNENSNSTVKNIYDPFSKKSLLDAKVFKAQNGYRIRQGVGSDRNVINEILKEPVEEGSVLPYPDAEIEKNIGNFYIYEDEVTKKIAGISCMKLFPVQKLNSRAYAVELSKICTAKGFEGKGIAKKLVGTMLEAARVHQQSPFSKLFYIDHVFALSNQPAMCHVFRKAGLAPTQRASLCSAWAKSYDMDRESVAFRYDLNDWSQQISSCSLT
eukprot:Nk52_evm12s287 gene=Nk52_evmTU12s287